MDRPRKTLSGDNAPDPTPGLGKGPLGVDKEDALEFAADPEGTVIDRGLKVAEGARRNVEAGRNPLDTEHAGEDGGAATSGAEEGRGVSRVSSDLSGDGDSSLAGEAGAKSSSSGPSAHGGDASSSAESDGGSASASGGSSGASGNAAASASRNSSDSSEDGSSSEGGAAEPPSDKAQATVKRAAATHAASEAAGSAAHAAGAALLLKGAASLVSGAVSAVSSGIGSFFAGVGTFFSTLVGIPATAATAVGGAITGAVAALSAAAVLAVGSAVVTPPEVAPVVDCATTVAEAASASDAGAVTDIEAIQLDYAKRIYSFLHYMGFCDEAIAAVIGSWQQESGIDPTGIEGIYDESEKYRVDGPKKTEALADISAYTVNKVLPLYDPDAIDEATYLGVNTHKAAPGMGLGQWTGDGVWWMMDMAEATGHEWYDFDFQLALSYCSSPARGAGWFENSYKNAGCTTLGETRSDSDWCYYFNHYFEGNVSFYDNKPVYSKQWLEKIKTFTPDAAYAQSVKSMVETMGQTATSDATHEAVSSTKCAQKNCVRVTSIATAAVELSQPTQSLAKTTCLDTYSKVIDYIFPGVNAKDCGHGAACAVRWSGADDDFPVGATTDQAAYMAASPRWEKVASSLSSSDVSKLEPGDVVVCDSHVLIYVGHEAIEAKWGDKAASDSDFCHASLDERYMSCGDWSLATYLSSDSRTYDAYRCTDPMDSKTYAAAGSLPGATTACTEDGKPQEATTAEGEAIVNSAVNGSFPAKGGMCAQWVSYVIQDAVGFYPALDACGYYWTYCTSSNKADLKPGMVIAVPSHDYGGSGYNGPGKTYGHVGIYIGNNTVRHNIGGVSEMDLDAWISYYGGLYTPKWGWCVKAAG